MALMITGLAQETDLENLESSQTFLVINGGALRIPIDEDSVRKILEYTVKDKAPETVEAVPEQDEEEESMPNGVDEEEGPTDEAGISQI